VQRAMLQLWREQARGWLTNDAYDRAGGIDALVTAALDGVLAGAPAEAAAALLQRLVQRGTDGSLVLSTMSWARSGLQPALQGEGLALMEALARAGLLAIWREAGDIELALACRPRAWPSLERWLQPAEPARHDVEAITRAYAAWVENRWTSDGLLVATGVRPVVRPWLARGELAYAEHRQLVRRRQRRTIGAAVVVSAVLVGGFVVQRARQTQYAEAQVTVAQQAASEAQRSKTEIAATQKAIEDARAQQRVATWLPVGATAAATAPGPRLKLVVYRSGTAEAEADAVMRLLGALPAGEYELPATLPQAKARSCGEVAFFHAEDAVASRRLFDALNGVLARAQDPRTLDLSDRSLASNDVPRGTVVVSLPPQALGPAVRQDRWGDSVLVPAGCAVVGSDQKSRDTLRRGLTAADLDWYATELPAHRDWVDGFYIGRTEVTALAFRAYQDACERYKDCPPWRPRYLDPQREPLRPATFVSWSQADAYCRWAGGRLPTDLEWEKAARGTDGRFWPWGFQPDDSLYHGKSKRTRAPVAVGSYPDGRSPYGALDMAGNVWEYTADRWRPEGGGHTIRGGSYLNTLMESRGSVRWSSGSEDAGTEHLGFRCAVPLARAGS
jgi:formylglycine-generating enzyme required for sulfatase activity